MSFNQSPLARLLTDQRYADEMLALMRDGTVEIELVALFNENDPETGAADPIRHIGQLQFLLDPKREKSWHTIRLSFALYGRPVRGKDADLAMHLEDVQDLLLARRTANALAKIWGCKVIDNTAKL